MKRIVKENDAKQGIELHHVRWVLVISIVSAAVAIVSVAVYVI